MTDTYDDNGILVPSSLDLSPVKAPSLDPEGDAAAQEAARQLVQARLALLQKMREGRLSFAEYKALPLQLQIPYKKQFGRPKTADQMRRAATRKKRIKARNTLARASRRINRQIAAS